MCWLVTPYQRAWRHSPTRAFILLCLVVGTTSTTSVNATMAAMANGVQMLDTRTEMKVNSFNGDDAQWQIWTLRFEAYTALLGWEDLMAAAAEATVPIHMDSIGDENVRYGKQLWHLLLSKCDGRALGIIRGAGKHNGFESWRLLKAEYESREGGRFTAMLRYVLNPGAKWTEDSQKAVPFLQSLQDWRQVVQDYCDQSGETLTNNVLVSVVLEHAPQPFRDMLLAAPPAARVSVETCRERIREYYNQSRQ